MGRRELDREEVKVNRASIPKALCPVQHGRSRDKNVYTQMVCTHQEIYDRTDIRLEELLLEKKLLKIVYQQYDSR